MARLKTSKFLRMDGGVGCLILTATSGLREMATKE